MGACDLFHIDKGNNLRKRIVRHAILLHIKFFFVEYIYRIEIKNTWVNKIHQERITKKRQKTLRACAVINPIILMVES